MLLATSPLSSRCSLGVFSELLRSLARFLQRRVRHLSGTNHTIKNNTRVEHTCYSVPFRKIISQSISTYPMLSPVPFPSPEDPLPIPFPPESTASIPQYPIS
jgi:hypothetical protein